MTAVVSSPSLPRAPFRQYALHRELLEVLERHGVDVDDLAFAHPRGRLLERRGAPARLTITVHGRVRA